MHEVSFFWDCADGSGFVNSPVIATPPLISSVVICKAPSYLLWGGGGRGAVAQKMRAVVGGVGGGVGGGGWAD